MAIGPIGPQLPLAPTYRPPVARVPSESGLDTPSIVPGPLVGAPRPPVEGPGLAADSFSRLLSDAVGQIDKMQKSANANVEKLATGQPVDMHDVTISAEQASLSFQLGLQVRNKLIEAYQEVMRMQV